MEASALSLTGSGARRYLGGMLRSLVISLVFGIGCWPQGGEDLPGELVGEFEVEGSLIEQSCGAAVPAADPIEVDFALSVEDSGRAYYQLSSGATFVGTESGDEYLFQTSQSWMVLEPDPLRGFAGCSVTQRDVFTFVVEQNEPDTENDADDDTDEGDPTMLRVSGSQTTEITPLTGSDCGPAVVSGGGNFAALPCRTEYVINGTGF